MTSLQLVIGNKNYSSWSMRPWILMRERAIEFAEVQIPLRRDDSPRRKLEYSAAGKVPVLIDGHLAIWESLAIIEYLAERFPDAQIWPPDPHARAVARALSAEMHAGFENLRGHMFFNCRARFPGRGRGPGVADDIARVTAIWSDWRQRFAANGEFLFGRFSAADAMFAPVVMRFATYAVELDPTARRYADAVQAVPAVEEWTSGARVEPWTIDEFEYA
jgi:glutathione S-transferase